MSQIVLSAYLPVRLDRGHITLAATLYQPRLFSAAPAVIYIHGWGGHRLTGEDNLAYYISGGRLHCAFVYGARLWQR